MPVMSVGLPVSPFPPISMHASHFEAPFLCACDVVVCVFEMNWLLDHYEIQEFIPNNIPFPGVYFLY